MLLFLCSVAGAVEMREKLAISPFIGASIPIGDAADNDPNSAKSRGAKPGFAVVGNAEYFLTENLAAGLRFGYNRFGFDDEVAELPPGAELDAHWTIIEFAAYLKLLLSAGSPTRPYFKAGVLAGKADAKGDITFEGESAEGKIDIANSLGLEGAVGVLHMFSDNMGGFLEAGVTHLMTDGKDLEQGIDDDIETGEAEGNFQWISIRGGMTFFLGM
jgi:opacity protein-like surface antigen